MKKKNAMTILLTCLFISAILWGMWAMFPALKLGSIILSDKINPHILAKSNIKHYVQDKYGEKVKLKTFSYTGEFKKDILIANIQESKTNQDFHIYYDLATGHILIDSYKIASDVYKHNIVTVTTNDIKRKANSFEEKALMEQQILHYYKKELEKTTIQKLNSNDSKEIGFYQRKIYSLEHILEQKNDQNILNVNSINSL